MEKRYYTADTLSDELKHFEAEYGYSSDAFFRAYERNDYAGVPWFEGIIWADTYREFLRLTDASPRASAPQPVH